MEWLPIGIFPVSLLVYNDHVIHQSGDHSLWSAKRNRFLMNKCSNCGNFFYLFNFSTVAICKRFYWIWYNHNTVGLTQAQLCTSVIMLYWIALLWQFSYSVLTELIAGVQEKIVFVGYSVQTSRIHFCGLLLVDNGLNRSTLRKIY